MDVGVMKVRKNWECLLRYYLHGFGGGGWDTCCSDEGEVRPLTWGS